MSIEKNVNVVVIGGGAAGMMAALFAAQNGASVILLEKNEKLGKKIYITGKGRCNLTNDCPLDDFLQNVPRNPRFLYTALHHLSPQDTMAFMERLGCSVKTERGHRVFPQSDKASDVTKALKYGMDREGVQTRLCEEVEALCVHDGAITGVRLASGEEVQADAVIIATGGLSYPSTGSTGDGFRLAKSAGHQVTPTYPSLTGFNTKDAWTKSLQGLSLKNIRLSAFVKNKKIFDETGEMLFTHFGISGPLPLELSSLICDSNIEDVKVYLDLKPGLTPEQINARLLREFSGSGKKKLSSMMNSYLPQRFASWLPELAQVDANKLVSQVSAAERNRLVQALKNLPINLLSTRSFSEAIITRGGVNVKEINASTMGSKSVRGLYFAGEVLDVDAFTGGFNLQIAFSTGALAGASAALLK